MEERKGLRRMSGYEDGKTKSRGTTAAGEVGRLGTSAPRAIKYKSENVQTLVQNLSFIYPAYLGL
jgi:hypothetical protein